MTFSPLVMEEYATKLFPVRLANVPHDVTLGDLDKPEKRMQMLVDTIMRTDRFNDFFLDGHNTNYPEQILLDTHKLPPDVVVVIASEGTPRPDWAASVHALKELGTEPCLSFDEGGMSGFYPHPPPGARVIRLASNFLRPGAPHPERIVVGDATFDFGAGGMTFPSPRATQRARWGRALSTCGPFASVNVIDVLPGYLGWLPLPFEMITTSQHSLSPKRTPAFEAACSVDPHDLAAYLTTAYATLRRDDPNSPDPHLQRKYVPDPHLQLNVRDLMNDNRIHSLCIPQNLSLALTSSDGDRERVQGAVESALRELNDVTHCALMLLGRVDKTGWTGSTGALILSRTPNLTTTTTMEGSFSSASHVWPVGHYVFLDGEDVASMARTLLCRFAPHGGAIPAGTKIEVRRRVVAITLEELPLAAVSTLLPWQLRKLAHLEFYHIRGFWPLPRRIPFASLPREEQALLDDQNRSLLAQINSTLAVDPLAARLRFALSKASGAPLPRHQCPGALDGAFGDGVTVDELGIGRLRDPYANGIGRPDVYNEVAIGELTPLQRLVMHKCLARLETEKCRVPIFPVRNGSNPPFPVITRKYSTRESMSSGTYVHKQGNVTYHWNTTDATLIDSLAGRWVRFTQGGNKRTGTTHKDDNDTESRKRKLV